MELKNDELLQVAAMYIGAPISFLNPVTKEWSKYRKLTPTGLQLIENGNMQWLLLLTPVSEITDEHALEFAKMAMHKSVWTSDVGRNRLKLELQEAVMSDGYKYGPLSYISFQYLISKRYAVPIWFGALHWANGRTAFELGIAIESSCTVK